MTTDVVLLPRYDLRAELVRDVPKENTKLSDDVYPALAVQLLHTIETIPEQVSGWPLTRDARKWTDPALFET